MEFKEVSTKEEIFNLPYYLTENGRKRYMEIFGQDCYKVFDEYGRTIEDYWYGYWWKKFYNDRKHKVTVINHDAENGVTSKYTRKMEEWEYIKNYWKVRDYT